MLEDNKKIYILPSANKSTDKSVKLIIEDRKNETREERYYLSIKEVLFNILRWDFQLRQKLSRQQIHSERGKVKKGNYNEVINFLNKRGVSKKFIEHKINEEHTRFVFTSNWAVDSSLIRGKYGIFNIKPN